MSSAPPSRQPTPGLQQLFEGGGGTESMPLLSREPTPLSLLLLSPGQAGGGDAPASSEEATEALLSHVRASRRGGRQAAYVAPSREAGEAFGRQLAVFVDVVARGGAGTRAPPGGFYEAVASGEVVLLREMVRTGGPAIILRSGWVSRAATPAILLEAPHTFFDAQTMPIALALFQRLPPTTVRAFMWNTVHRGNAVDLAHKDSAVTRSGDLPSDMAHSPDSYFQRAHEVLIASGPRPEDELLTIQIHGFRTDLVPEADLVLAAAETHVRDMAKLKHALAQRLPALRVIESPQQTPVLTGMRNVQAAACRASPQPRPFLHCEFSHAWRRKFVDDPKLLGLLGEAFADVWG